MPTPERSGRLQKALLWNFLGSDPQGEPVLDSSPTEINVRSDLGLGTGGFVAIRSTLVVDRDIDIGSVMLLSSLDEWNGTGSSLTDAQYLKVVSFNKTPDVKARERYRQVRLELYRGTPPPRD